MKTLKYLLWAVAASCSLVACGGSDSDDPNPNPNPTPGTDGGLTVKLSKTVVQSDGTDFVEIQALYKGADVTSQAKYYALPDNREIDLRSGKYTATAPGVLQFWAAYGTASTYDTPSTITAVDFSTPERPDDPQPESTNFVRRVLALQFTGTGCGNCPRVIQAFRALSQDEKYADLFVHAADHSFNNYDPMYRDSKLAATFNVTSYPSVSIDMRQNPQTFEAAIASAIESCYKRMDAPAGISVHSKVSGNSVIAQVSVKAGVENSYYIGALVLESGIKAEQANGSGIPGDFSTHENAIRLIDANKNFKGYSLGTIKPGEVVDRAFAFNLDSSWKQENCHLVFYLCAPEGSNIYVCNAIATEGLAVNQPYDYK